MRTTIQAQLLIQALTSVAGAVCANATLPILGHVKLKADWDTLTITGTDLDTTIQRRVAANGYRNGEITLPFELLVKLLKKFDAESDITLAIDDECPNYVALTSGATSIKIPAVPASDFPPTPDLGIVSTADFTGDVIRDALEHTAFCMSTDDSRYVLNGICIQLQRHTTTITATDGRRLSRNTLDKPTAWLSELTDDREGVLKTVSLIIPSGAVHTLRSLLPAPKKDETMPPVYIHMPAITPGTPPSSIRIDIGQDLQLYTKLIQGEYPNCEAVIPKDYQHQRRAHIPVALLLPALERSALIGEHVNLTFDGPRLTLEAKNNESIKLVDILDLSDYRRMHDFSIGFNADYLLEACKAIDTEDISLRFGEDNLSPALIEQPDNKPWLHVLMPIRSDNPTKKEKETEEEEKQEEEESTPEPATAAAV